MRVALKKRRKFGLPIPSHTFKSPSNPAKLGELSIIDRYSSELRRSVVVAQFVPDSDSVGWELFDAKVIALSGDVVVISGSERCRVEGVLAEVVQTWVCRIGAMMPEDWKSPAVSIIGATGIVTV